MTPTPPIVDPLLSLAASLHWDRGAYAALIGSGMSTAAGIKTGWELTKELAELEAQHTAGRVPPDAEAWWAENKTVPLDYSTIMEAIAPTLAQRQAFLRSIIEPTPDEISAGLKIPTPAHRALAELVASGYVRVIITTNFDRLIESALRDQGIEEQMLSGPEDLARMIPIQHTACTVIKLHGDYQQANLRNTEAELGEYSEEWSNLLDRVLREYGLFTVGWSGKSDKALRQQIEASGGRRYGCFFGIRGDPPEEIQPLLDERRATLVGVTSANKFFDELTGTLTEVAQRPTRSLKTSAVVGTTKRLISQGRTRIDLRDVLLREARLLKAQLDVFTMVDSTNYLSELTAMVERGRPIAAGVATGAFYGEPGQRPLWADVFRLVADQPFPFSGATWVDWLGLRRLPAAMLLYAGVLAAWAVEDLTLAKILLDHEMRHTVATDSGAMGQVTYCPAYIALTPPEVLDSNALGSGAGPWPVPLSNVMVNAVEPVLLDQYAVKSDFAFAFEDVESLIAMLQHDWHVANSVDPHSRWAHPTFHSGLINVQGSYVGPPPPGATERFSRRVGPLDAASLLEVGMFGGDPQRLAAAQQAVSDQS